MSCFNGQMKEYTRIAIDRFDGKNLRCTAFFLSHCHKDHMTGLNSSSFEESLHTRNGIFLYCSEITRLLLLADEEYRYLQKYIRVLKVGMPQPVSIPGNSTSEAEYYVNVILISAGHCPGSVMFLFEGHEGRCLYTGDFRWEINHVAGIAAFKEENRLKHIKSIYVDTTFCIPEVYHIPKRSECIDAAATLIAGWLQRSTSHVVYMSCPARYGYEHLMMKLSAKLKIKIHVPEWKMWIYNQIPKLQNVFTCDPTETRLHACSAKMYCEASLPCRRSSESEAVSILNLRPSAMWFTSDKSTATDLVVPPAGPKGFYRMCYSLHSSYSEIRDLVSFLQPENVFPNVQPRDDDSIEVVQARLHSFQKRVHSARVHMSVELKPFQPLGTLRKIGPVHTCMQQPQNKPESLDEMVFSSQESGSRKGLLRNIIASSPPLSSPPPAAGSLEESKNLPLAACEASSYVWSSMTYSSQSSHRGAAVSEEELSASDGDDGCRMASQHMSTDGRDNNDDCCDTSKNVPNDKGEVIPTGDCSDLATHGADIGAADSSHCRDSQSTQVSLIRQQKPRKVSTTGADACGQSFGSPDKQENNAQERAVTNILMSCGESISVRPSSYTEVGDIRPSSYTEVGDISKNNLANVYTEVGDISKNNLANVYTVVDSFKDDDDVVYSSQVSSTTELTQNCVPTTVVDDRSATSDQTQEVCEAAATENIADNDTSQIPEVVSSLSSSDDSLNILDHDSQTLWSVSYSLQNFVQNDCNSAQVTTGTEISRSNLVPSIHAGYDEHADTAASEDTARIGGTDVLGCQSRQEITSSTYAEKENLSLKQMKETAVHTTAGHLALKRKHESNSPVKERGSEGIKRVTNVIVDDSTAEIKNTCHVSSQRAKDLDGSFSRFKKSTNDCKFASGERKISKVETAHPVTFKCRKDNMQNSNGCHHNYATELVQSIEICEKCDWIDLTMELPEEVIDLTKEDSQ